jgi:hypothetical protein
MTAIMGACLTASEVHCLGGAAIAGVLAALVRYVVIYALVARCLKQTRPEDRLAVLRGIAEVLRSLRGPGSLLRVTRADDLSGLDRNDSSRRRDFPPAWQSAGFGLPRTTGRAGQNDTGTD